MHKHILSYKMNKIFLLKAEEMYNLIVVGDLNS